MLHKLVLATLISMTLVVHAGRQVGLAASPEKDVLFIFDASKSMSQKTLGGKRKIDVAKAAFAKMVKNLPDSGSVKVGLMAYGHRIPAGQSNCCGDIELVVPVTSINRELLAGTVRNFNPRGKTPIAGSLTQAAETLLKLKTDRQKVIVLLTDGIETCGGDPLRAAARLQELGMKVDFYVIGFDLANRQVDKIKAIASAGSGTFLNAKNSKKLEEAFEVVEKVILNKPKKPSIPKRRTAAYFVDEFNGEQLADHWELINRDDDSQIVENGSLMLLATTPGSLEKGTIPNLLRLNKSLPDGDWTMTVQVRTRMQTARETIVFGLHQDADNYVLVNATYKDHGAWGVQCHIGATKMAKGRKSQLSRTAWKSGSGTIVEKLKNFPQPFQLRLEKRGRSYSVSYGFAAKSKKIEWVSVGKLTSLRAKGQLILGFHQREKVTGESSIDIDWIKIERNE